MKPETRSARAYADGRRRHQPLSPPLHQVTTFQVETAEAHRDLFGGGSDAVYQRFGNPTTTAAAERVAELEGAERALVFSSGMAAITTTLLALLKAGDHAIVQRQVFDQTHTFLTRGVRALGVEVTFVDDPGAAAVAPLLTDRTRLVYVETPSNPLLEVVDLKALSAVLKPKGVRLVVDNTFASPVLQTPIADGADVVLESASKYLGGHSDILAGTVASDRDTIRRIFEWQVLLGGTLAPFNAWLLQRSLRTVHLRVTRQAATALTLATHLEKHPRVSRVFYPYLESSPRSAAARKQMRGGGGVVSFTVKGGLSVARAVLNALQLIPIATSLGGVETIAEIPVDLDFGASEVTLGPRVTNERTPMPDGLVRLSVGLEHADDLVADLDRALDVRS